VLQDGEECDTGQANSDSAPDACRTSCLVAGCGDAVSDSGEECDAGGANSDTTPDACRTTCALPACGDAVVDSAEGCDNGASNSDTIPDTCRTSCELPACGDAVTDSAEQCDEGEANSDTTPDACRTSCIAAGCGDAVLDGGEQCDAGGANSNADPAVCRSDCRNEYMCGDADRNERISVVDAQKVLLVAVAIRNDCELGRCDANGDGRYSVLDAQIVLRAAVGLSATLSCTLPVTITVDDAVALDTLSVEVDYAGADSSFLGAGASVDCTALVAVSTSTFANDESESLLSIGLDAAGSVGGPAALVRCRYRARDVAPPPGALTVTATAATGADGEAISPPPSVSIDY